MPAILKPGTVCLQNIIRKMIFRLKTLSPRTTCKRTHRTRNVRKNKRPMSIKTKINKPKTHRTETAKMLSNRPTNLSPITTCPRTPIPFHSRPSPSP